ncbi:MAG: type II toxin-antitoxin system PemK/MazF family toxin [Patescibacteria group bacterium]|nr:type II toxin-antitoxin system PemK/MazF family toxin [Patescibacteria group bacterium]
MNEEYFKDFDKWNDKKKEVNSRIMPTDFFFLEQEVWWASIGMNVGNELDGKNMDFERPVLIIRKISRDLVWVLPMTRTAKSGDYFHPIKYRGFSDTVAILHIRSINTRRLNRFIFRANDEDFATIIEKTANILPLKTKPPTESGESRSDISGAVH